MKRIALAYSGVICAIAGLSACATQNIEPSVPAPVTYMDQAAVTAYVTDKTEEYSKGAGYYGDDGTIKIRWDGKDLSGTYVIKDDGNLCMVVTEWGEQEDCQQYAKVDDKVLRFYEGKPVDSVVKEGNALESY